MTEEIKINKLNKSITFINNGIAYSQFEIADEILDLITNLQQENENTKKLKERYQLEKEIYKSRCEKANEYMKDFIFEGLLVQEDRKLIMYNENLRKFENILNGSDKNDNNKNN